MLQTPLPTTPPYRDRKRYAWLLSLVVPCTVGIGPALMAWTGEPLVLWAPVAFFYLVAPLLDGMLGVDQSNPPESAVPALENDHYYRRITFLLVPVLWAAFIFSAWWVATQPLPWHGVLAMVLTTGTVGGFCINLGHELGHKNTALERWLAKLVLAPTAYGHFFIEHNRGHHRDVATPADPASSRMGESIYRFVLREMPGAARRAWALEKDRLAAVFAGGVFLGQLSADLGQLCRALRAAAAKGRQRPLRTLPPAAFVEQQPRVLQLGPVPSAAALRPPRAPAAPLPISAAL